MVYITSVKSKIKVLYHVTTFIQSEHKIWLIPYKETDFKGFYFSKDEEIINKMAFALKYTNVVFGYDLQGNNKHYGVINSRKKRKQYRFPRYSIKQLHKVLKTKDFSEKYLIFYCHGLVKNLFLSKLTKSFKKIIIIQNLDVIEQYRKAGYRPIEELNLNYKTLTRLKQNNIFKVKDLIYYWTNLKVVTVFSRYPKELLKILSNNKNACDEIYNKLHLFIFSNKSDEDIDCTDIPLIDESMMENAQLINHAKGKRPKSLKYI